MEAYTDGPASCKLDDSASVPIQQQIATKDELFAAVLKYVKPASLARTATELLFWCHYATHEFKGRKGIYKEDEELGKSLGIHPKTAGRHTAELCASGSKNEPGKVQLFEVAYGPKPRARSGRVRWLFIRPEGRKIIDEALEGRRLRRKRAAPTDGKEKFRPRGARHSNRSPQNAPTLISHTYLPDKRSGKLSLQPAEEREPTASKRKESQEKMEMGGKDDGRDVPKGMDSQGQVNRLVQTWRSVCERSNKHDLIWRDQDLDRLSGRLAKTVADLGLHEISDADLETRLTVLCNNIATISEDMSEGFAKFNRDGLELSSFVMYGPKLMKAAARLASKPKPVYTAKKAPSAKELFGD